MIFATCRIFTILFFRFVAALFFYFSKKRRPVAAANVDLCFPPEKNSDKKKNNKIVKKSYLSLGHSAADFLLMRFYNKKNIDKYITTEGMECFYDAQKKGKGVIIITAHFGNWELAAHYLALKGIKSLVLYNPIKAKNFLWFERFVKNNRQRSGNILISKKNSLFNVYKHLRRGGNVVLISDQHCYPPEGIQTKFFNQNVWSHKAFAELSLKTGAPIVSGFMFIKNLNKYLLKVYKPLYPQDFEKFKNPEIEIASSGNKILEDAILRSPGQWMWQHRRFKNI
ncbi:MAG: lysophospholipid acyltransferase family protein [bacterium]